MGVFNFFIVIPQILASLGLGLLMKSVLGDNPMNAVLLGGSSMIVAGLCVGLVSKEVDTVSATGVRTLLAAFARSTKSSKVATYLDPSSGAAIASHRIDSSSGNIVKTDCMIASSICRRRTVGRWRVRLPEFPVQSSSHFESREAPGPKISATIVVTTPAM